MATVDDPFFIGHLLGWFGKALIFRDYWLTWTYSILFELVCCGVLNQAVVLMW